MRRSPAPSLLAPLLVAATLAAAGCAPRVTVPESERARTARELEGQRRHARVALFVGPFFGDDTRRLVTDVPRDELDLLESPDGTPTPPPMPDGVLLPGTPLRIRAVEFPTGWIIATRVVTTPRYHPWVYLDVPGDTRPGILVLPQTVATAEAARAEIDRLLGTEDRSAEFRALPEAQRAAIALKRPSEGMTPAALEMAWGYPEKKVVDRPAGTEEWSWSGGKRTASLRDGRLVRWQAPAGSY